MVAGLPALPTPTIWPSLMPISPLTMPSTGSITSGIAHEHVERAHGAVVAWRQPDAVAQRLAAAMQALFARNGEIVLDLGEQRGVAEPDASPTVGPYICA